MLRVVDRIRDQSLASVVYSSTAIFGSIPVIDGTSVPQIESMLTTPAVRKIGMSYSSAAWPSSKLKESV